MKKQLCFILALTLLAALVAVPVFALPDANDYPGETKPMANDIVTLTGFYNIGETAGVTVQPATAGGIVDGQQMSVDVDDNTTYDDITMYPDSDSLRVTFTGAVADKQYFIMLSRGAEKSTSAALFYVNQLSGSAIQNFTVKSSLLTADEPVLTLWLISEDSNDDAVSVSMSYLAGTAHYKEPSAGYTVFVDSKVNTEGDHSVSVVGIVSGGAFIGDTAFTVECDISCAVAYTTDSGVSYARLSPTAVSADKYSYTLPVETETTVVIAYAGDINFDKEVNALDESAVARALLPTTHRRYQALSVLALSFADVNGDDEFDALDQSTIARSLLPTTHRRYQPISWK